MSMTEPPISYSDARDALKLVNFHLARSAPSIFGMTGPKFAEMCTALANVEKLLAAIVEHRAKGGRS